MAFGERRAELRAGSWPGHSSGGVVARVARAGAIGLLLGFWIGSAGAQADPAGDSAVPNYDQIVERAIDAFSAQRFAQARTLFEQAHTLAPSARTLRGLGVTAFALNRYTQARPELEAALADVRNPLTRDQYGEVTEILAWMQANLGSLRLHLSPPYALATVDERPIAKGANLLEPGRHTLHVQASDYESRDENFVLDREKPLELRVELHALPSDAMALSIKPPTAAPPPQAPILPVSRPMTISRPRDTESTRVFERWWFWTLAGVAIGATAIVVVMATQAPDPRALPAGVRVGTP
jgi:hypothetical protein